MRSVTFPGPRSLYGSVSVAPVSWEAVGVILNGGVSSVILCTIGYSGA